MDLIDKSKKHDKIKFWKSVPSYVLVWQYQSNKWENLKNDMFYRKQIAYTCDLWPILIYLLNWQYYCTVSSRYFKVYLISNSFYDMSTSLRNI